MNFIRYTFSAIYCDGYVYAIGGRKYGGDDVAVISSCERMNLKTLTWERIATLNYSRCTSMHYVYNNMIFVAGGFYINGERLSSIECYDPKVNVWYLMGLTIPLAIEASVTCRDGDNIYFIGGRENDGDSTKITKLNMADEPLDLSEITITSQ